MASRSDHSNHREPQKTQQRHKTFNKRGFNTATDAGQIQTNFLDVKLNLLNKIYITFRKLNWDILS